MLLVRAASSQGGCTTRRSVLHLKQTRLASISSPLIHAYAYVPPSIDALRAPGSLLRLPLPCSRALEKAGSLLG